VDTEELRAFLQERLGLFGKWIFIFSGGFLLIGLVIGTTFDPRGYWGYSPLGAQDLSHLAATLVLGGVWLVARTRTLSPGVLRILDACAIVTACVLVGFMGLSIAGEPIIAVFVTLLASTHAVVFRAIMVPSTAGRTAWISALSFVPIVVTSAYLMSAEDYPSSVLLSFMISNATWCVLAIAVGAVASDVIFGLRREIQHARRLGQYTLERKIGEGGMGAVYRASHVMLRRPTAIKAERWWAAYRARPSQAPPPETDSQGASAVVEFGGRLAER
jgi:serine/threonine-protein kinase